MNKASVVDSSFRDPSGSVLTKRGEIYRSINYSYQDEYEHLIKSGLYKKLTDLKLLITHKEIRNKLVSAYKGIKPAQVPFISYPYEWCFSQLKDAALLTLQIQKTALDFGMTLKDSSVFNIQFFQGKPILIDTLSFRKYEQGKPWVAYRQFCMHFLAPLLLMKHKSVELNKLLRIYIDGIPLDLTSSLLPRRTWFQPLSLIHIHLHGKTQAYFEDKEADFKEAVMSKQGLIGLINSLENAISKMNLKISQKHWLNYYQTNNYSSKSFESKKKILLQFIEIVNPKNVWDLGSNTGKFDHLILKKDREIICFDSDHFATEENYSYCKNKNITNCLPLVIDLTNPSPGIGWAHKERMPLFERGFADTVMALALIHHLTITYGIPFSEVAKFLSKICKYLIIEFVPKDDPQVQRLLINRKDIFIDYKKEVFEEVFSKYFRIQQMMPIQGSLRYLYLMKNLNQT